MFSKKYTQVNKNQGFSLIELLITSAIITIVTAIIVVKHGAFNNAVLLKNQAYELALAIREAQVYAVSSKGEGSNFRERYGVFVGTSGLAQQQMIVYIEEDTGTGAASRSYNDGTDTILETLVLDSRFEVSDICVDVSSVETCNLNHIAISFKRPDFDPILNPAGIAAVGVDSTRIIIAPVNGSSFTRTIEVTQTGQISVK